MFSSAPVTALFLFARSGQRQRGFTHGSGHSVVVHCALHHFVAVIPLNPGLWSPPRRVPKVTISALPWPFALLPKPQGRTAAVAVPKVTIAPTTVRDTQSHKMLFLIRLWAWADCCFSFGAVDWL